MWFSSHAGDATKFEKLHDQRVQKIARVATALLKYVVRRLERLELVLSILYSIDRKLLKSQTPNSSLPPSINVPKNVANNETLMTLGEKFIEKNESWRFHATMLDNAKWILHITSRWGDDPYIASYSYFKIRPFLDVTLPHMARFRHFQDFTRRENSVPDIEARQFSNVILIWVKAATKRILFLPNNEESVGLRFITRLQPQSTCSHDAIFVNFPRAIRALPCGTNMMPVTVIHRHTAISAEKILKCNWI